MMAIQMREMQKAIRSLEAVGCRYAILSPEGDVYGDLPVVTEESKTRKQRRNYTALDVVGRLSKMKVGDVLVFEPTEELDVDSIQSNVSGRGVKMFGVGNFATYKDNGNLQCMRLK